MKKMYKQPVTATEDLESIGQTLCASTEFGGETDGIVPPGGEIIAG